MLKRILKNQIRRYLMLKGYALTKVNPQEIISIPEITPIRYKLLHTDIDSRLNLLIPSVQIEHVFGGIATALRFFNQIIQPSHYKKFRIIVTDSDFNDSDTKWIKDNYLSSLKIEHDIEFISIADRLNTSLSIHKHDVFITTAWWTAYCIQPILNEFSDKQIRNIYFVQDFEPGFYPWSSRYLLSLSTYGVQHSDKTIAVFNTKELSVFFHKHKYQFYKKSYFFNPNLNPKLYHYLNHLPNEVKKEKIILLYGRPGVSRNAFELVAQTLLQLSTKIDLSEWKIYSLGEAHQNIPLHNSTIISLGKVSLQEYADLMSQAYLGLSLMVSPHPSYPPLEMAKFGVQVITNGYDQKDLSIYSDNINSLSDTDCNQENISVIMLEKIKNFPAMSSAKIDKTLGLLDEGNLEEFLFIGDLLKHLNQ